MNGHTCVSGHLWLFLFLAPVNNMCSLILLHPSPSHVQVHCTFMPMPFKFLPQVWISSLLNNCPPCELRKKQLISSLLLSKLVKTHLCRVSSIYNRKKINFVLCNCKEVLNRAFADYPVGFISTSYCFVPHHLQVKGRNGRPCSENYIGETEWTLYRQD